MTSETWLILLLCCLLALCYCLVVDLLRRVRPAPQKYAALLIAFLTAALAFFLAGVQRYIGAPILGLFFGMLILNDPTQSEQLSRD